jgi:hypothetical protein
MPQRIQNNTKMDLKQTWRGPNVNGTRCVTLAVTGNVTHLQLQFRFLDQLKQ